MDRKRHERLEKLFNEALNLLATERSEYLDRECQGDFPLRHDVESLLAADDGTSGILDKLLLRAFPAIDPMIDKQVGPYLIGRCVGSGGMGEVYEAERRDGHFRKRVALKLVRKGRESKEFLDRFHRERQILASIEHPNIARLLDGGASEEGLPYLVMEYVDGEPLNLYCDNRRMTLKQRLALFRKVCSAISFIHGRLIVHRDLKPANVLVGSGGEPKVLDFGIAKLLDPGAMPDVHTDSTELGARPMTPAYASPEQIRGEPMTTASDTYSLGVMLYELLTGHRPYWLTTLNLQHILELVCEREPLRPSNVVQMATDLKLMDGQEIRLTPESVSRTRGASPEKLHRLLRGDLDQIALMALRKEPDRRYSSPEALSEDIRRHLEGLPIRAARDSFAYRLGKFVGRHKAGVAAATLLAVVVAGAAIGLAFQARRVAVERDKAQMINNFLQETLGAADPITGKGRSVTVGEVLDDAVQRIPRTFANNPETEAAIQNTIGTVYYRLARYEEANPLLEFALETRRKLLGTDNLDTAESLQHLGRLRFRQGSYDEAEQLLRQALAVQRRRLGDTHPVVADTLLDLGTLLRSRGQLDEALAPLSEASAIRNDIGDEQALASIRLEIGVTLWSQGRYEEAEPHMRYALDTRRRILRPGHPLVADSLNNLGALLENMKRYEEAEQLHEQALTILRREFGNEHDEVSTTLQNLAVVAENAGHLDKAERLYSEALELDRKLLAADHPDLAISMANFGGFLTDLGKPGQAKPYLEEALRILDKAVEPSHWQLAQTRSLYGACLAALGRYDDAEKELLAASNSMRETLGANNYRTLKALSRLAILYEVWGRSEEAAEVRATLATHR